MLLFRKESCRVFVEDGQFVFADDGGGRIVSPAMEHWSLAVGWDGNAPARYFHGTIGECEADGEEWVLRGAIEMPRGECICQDRLIWRPNGLLEIRRRWHYHGSRQENVTLCCRFRIPERFADILMPGILYYGNPAGSRTPGVPVLSRQSGQKGFFEEHRFPMPWVMAESPEAVCALHSIPSPVPYSLEKDIWWSLGCEYRDDCTELAGYSGYTSVNGLDGFVKSGQKHLELLPNHGMLLEDGAVVEKTFFLQLSPAKGAGQGVVETVNKALGLWHVEAMDIDIADVIRRKYDYAIGRRYHEEGRVSGALFNTAENYRPEIVYGWCGRSEVMGFAAPLIGTFCGDGKADERSERCWDFLCSSPITECGFAVNYDIEAKTWSGWDFVSQGQTLEMLARDLLERRKHGRLVKAQWMQFLTNACAAYARHVEADDWRPVSTCEAFMASPLAKCFELTGEERFKQDAIRLADHYMARHLSMKEPYWGGTLDATCEDKEAAAAAMEAFHVAWLLTGRQKYLAAAEHATAVFLTYLQCWNIPMPCGRLADCNFKSMGWTAVSVQNMHLDVYGVWVAPLLWRIADALKNSEWNALVLPMLVNCGQLVDAVGCQGEQIQQTNFSQSAQYPNLENMRGGYVEHWQVFWITAAFLSCAAEFEQLGIGVFNKKGKQEENNHNGALRQL